MRERPPALAGTWYPATAAGCRKSFETFVVGKDPVRDHSFFAGVVPHAGWTYSGKVAYQVFARLAVHDDISTVILFAGHLAPNSAPTVMADARYLTPFGVLDTDADMANDLARFPGICVETPSRHTQDNSTEVELPFIKYFWPDARLVVIGAPPDQRALSLGQAVRDAAERRHARVIVLASTDLTHYGPNYGWSPQGTGSSAERWVRDVNDRRFLDVACARDASAAIERGVSERSACCPGAVAAALAFLGRSASATEPLLLSYQTSADIMPATSFVGYAGILL